MNGMRILEGEFTGWALDRIFGPVPKLGGFTALPSPGNKRPDRRGCEAAGANHRE